MLPKKNKTRMMSSCNISLNFVMECLPTAVEQNKKQEGGGREREGIN